MASPDDRYTGLRRAVALSAGLSVAVQVLGVLVLVAAALAWLYTMSQGLPMLQAVLVAGGLAGLGLALLVIGWQLQINAERINLQINLADDVARVADATARTAAAVERLAGSVRRPPAQ